MARETPTALLESIFVVIVRRQRRGQTSTVRNRGRDAGEEVGDELRDQVLAGALRMQSTTTGQTRNVYLLQRSTGFSQERQSTRVTFEPSAFGRSSWVPLRKEDGR